MSSGVPAEVYISPQLRRQAASLTLYIIDASRYY